MISLQAEDDAKVFCRFTRKIECVERSPEGIGKSDNIVDLMV